MRISEFDNNNLFSYYEKLKREAVTDIGLGIGNKSRSVLRGGNMLSKFQGVDFRSCIVLIMKANTKIHII